MIVALDLTTGGARGAMPADDDGPGWPVRLAPQSALDLLDGACGWAGGVVVAVLAAAVAPRESRADRLLGDQHQQGAPDPDDDHQKQQGAG